MKGQIPRIFTVIAISLVIGLALLISRPWSQRKERTRAAPLDLKLIETGMPRRQPFFLSCRWFGRVKSKQRVRIIAPEAGRIISIHARDEIPLKQGNLLFILGGPRIDARLKGMQDRITALKERISLTNGSIAMKQEAVNEKIGKREELTASKDSLVHLQSDLKVAKLDLQSFQDAIRVLAPIDGVFTRRSVCIGQNVDRGDNLAELIAPKELRVVAYLFPPVDTILKGKKTTIHTANGDSVSATVVRELPERTPEGAIVIWIEGDDIEHILKPGETVKGELVLSVHKGALAVPEGAIVRDEHEQAYVFIKRNNGYHKRAVRTGLTSAGWVEITSGITKESEVVIRGAYELLYRDFNKVYKVVD